MIYIIPEEEAKIINEKFPDWRSFCDKDNKFDTLLIQYFDFDYNSIFQWLFNKNLSQYLADKEQINKNYVIHNYIHLDSVPRNVCPKDQDYNILWLDKIKTFENWELMEVNYMGIDWDWNYSVLVVKEVNHYHRGVDWYVQYREKTITWYYEDWTPWETKKTKKSYTIMEAAVAGKKIRENVIEDLKPSLVWFLMQESWVSPDIATERGMWLLIVYKDDILFYIEWIKTKLISSISNDTQITRLDNNINWLTPRQFILNKINT